MLNFCVSHIKLAFSFADGSATKTPRKVPVILNSEKLANRAICYGSYLSIAGAVRFQAEVQDDGTKQLRRTDTAGEYLGGQMHPANAGYDSRVSEPLHEGFRREGYVS